MRGFSLLCAFVGLVVVAGCAPARAPSATPDPFSAVAQQAADAYQQGLDLDQQGRHAEALDALKRAQLLSPTDDPGIDAAVNRLAAELAPTPTPAPPTATPLPEPTDVAKNTATPVAIPTDTPAPTLAPQPLPAMPVLQPPTATPAPTSPAPAMPQRVEATPPPVAVAPSPQPTPTQLTATFVSVPGQPTAIDVAESSDQLFVADRSGLIWTLDHGLPTLHRPFSLPGEPAGIAADLGAGRVYIALRSQAGIAVLDMRSGQQTANLALPSNPGDMRLDASLGLLFVVTPESATVTTVNMTDGSIVWTTAGLDQVTGIALDQDSHTLEVSQLDGVVAAIDEKSGQIISRVQLSDVGLTGISNSNGQLYAVNTPGQELVRFDLSSGEASRVHLSFDPLAIVTGPQSGAAYILSTDAIMRIDPSDGSELTRVSFGGLELSVPELDADQLWMRPRIAINPTDEAVSVIDAERGLLVLSPPLN
jgi:outer membrane protein assembly factor BamB